jgi:colanic acid biosynthesis glycosyl transferase WcaI
LHRSKKIIKITDIHPDALVKIGLIKNRLLIRVLEVLEIMGYKGSDHIIVIAEGYKRNLLIKLVDAEKITVISNWADLDRISSLQEKGKGVELPNLENKFIVTYAGTMSWPQDLETVIEAAELLKDYKDITFLLVGEGVKKELLVKRANILKLTNVVFMPLQPPEVYFKILQMSAICIVPLCKSFDSPTSPSKMHEIMAIGKPIIANVPDHSDVHEIVNHAGCGLWVESENPQMFSEAVMRLYNDRQYARSIGENGKRFVERTSSLTKCTDAYEKLVDQVM